MTSRKFAISVPIGAWHPLLPECLSSLVLQGDHVEIAALDASRDARVAATLDRFNDHLAYRRTGPDNGQSDAIIEGWRHTTGAFLGWLNADDALYPGALQAVSRHLDGDPSLDVLYADSTIIDDSGAYRGYHWAVRAPDATLLRDCIISQPSCLFRRKCVEAVGGLNADLHYTMDWDLWVRLWRAGAKFEFIDGVFSRVLWSREAKTGGFNAARRQELERIIGANKDIVGKAKSRLGFALHYLMEYRAPAFLKRAVRRSNASRGRIISGVDRVGAIHERARLPMVQLAEQEARGVTLIFSEGALGTIVIDGNETTYEGGRNQIELLKPALCGDVVTLEVVPSTSTYFEAASWS